jgi:hypothetical protein
MRQVWEDWKIWKLLELEMACYSNIRGAVTKVGNNRSLFIMGCLESASYLLHCGGKVLVWIQGRNVLLTL